MDAHDTTGAALTVRIGDALGTVVVVHKAAALLHPRHGVVVLVAHLQQAGERCEITVSKHTPVADVEEKFRVLQQLATSVTYKQK
jgi:hypothetical protein